jgi:hypothetical protein
MRHIAGTALLLAEYILHPWELKEKKAISESPFSKRHDCGHDPFAPI